MLDFQDSTFFLLFLNATMLLLLKTKFISLMFPQQWEMDRVYILYGIVFPYYAT